MKELPCIGLSSNLKDGLSCISNAYVNAIIKAGGCPVLIPVINDTHSLVTLVSHLDGLILSGGGDIHPSFFKEEPHPAIESVSMERDLFDLELIRLASDRQMPILGICRGHQILNVAFGGSLYQDIPSQYPHSTIIHNQTEDREIGTHKVLVEKDSLLNKILGKDSLLTNSFHHQAIKGLAPGFRSVATTEDGINEAIESTQCKSILGVQWHPENMAVCGNETMLDLFRYLIEEASLFKQAKTIHKKILTIDSHCDTPIFFEKGINIGKKTTLTKVDIPKMNEGMLDATFMIAYLEQGERDDISSQTAFNKAMSIIDQLHLQIEQNNEWVGLARSEEDLIRLKSLNKKAIFIGVENGYAIGKDIHNLSMFKEKGVSYITLCHNGDNDLCDSALGNSEHNGLSPFGKEAVKEMNRLGIIVDISHTSEKTSRDVLEISQYPVIASHSSVKALCNHNRNLSDELMKVVAAKGGVVQICFYNDFISDQPDASLWDAINHIEYAVNLIGIDHVGIGTDFDGGGGLVGINSANEVIGITIELIRRGYTESDIAKIWGGNLLRVMDRVQKFFIQS